MAVSTDDYESLIKRRQALDQEIQKCVAATRDEALHKVIGMVTFYGLAVEEVFPSIKRNAVKRKIPAKYRNPNQPSQLWSGRGSRPNWVTDHLSQGGSLDDLLMESCAKGLASTYVAPIDGALNVE